jgi:hypothetical protein
MNQPNQTNQNNLNYDNELNTRLENRNKPSSPLQPLYDFRPVSTKYTLFHKIDESPRQSQSQSQHHNSHIYDPYQVFNPGDRAPIDYFMRNVDVESTLRSQFFALQTSPQAVYVPELNSQLYNNPMAYSPEFFSPTDATTEKAKCVGLGVDNESIFYNCIRNNSKK